MQKKVEPNLNDIWAQLASDMPTRRVRLLQRLRDLNLLEALGIASTATILFAVFCVMFQEVLRPAVLVDPFIVPKSFEENGYTPQTIGNQVNDAIEQQLLDASIQTTASLTAERPDRPASKRIRPRHGTGILLMEEVNVPLVKENVLSAGDWHEIEVPEAKIPLRDLVAFVHDLLRRPHISGEITLASSALPGQSSNTASDVQHIIITIRLKPYKYELVKAFAHRSRESEIADRHITRYGKQLLDQLDLKSTQPRDAILWLSKEILFLTSPNIHDYLGNSLYQNGDFDAAIKEYKAAISVNDQDTTAHLNLFVALDAIGDYDDAAFEFQRTLKLIGQAKNAKYVYAHYNWGNALYDQGKYSAAIAEYNKALDIDPKFVAAYNGRGNVYVDEGDYGDGMVEYQHATAVDPLNVDSYINLGSVLADRGDYNGALSKFRQAVMLDPENANAYTYWGHVLAERHDYGGANAKFQKATELDPDYVEAYMNWGVVLANGSDYDGAISKFQKATELDPDYVEAYMNWGVVLAKKHDYEGANAKFQKAIELDPEYAPVYDNWGNALRARGDRKGAAMMYAKALRLEPDNQLFKGNYAAMRSSTR